MFPFNNHSTVCTDKNYKYLIIFIVSFALLLRYLFIGDRYFWGDESSSALISEENLVTLLDQAAHDVHPPLYYILLHLWMRIFGESIVAIRLLSVLFGVITVYVTIRLTEQISNKKAALIAGWFMAILPMAVQYSQEARMYSLLCMLLLSATYFLIKWLKEPSNHKHLIFYAVLMVLSFYTHYFTIFTFMIHWLYLVHFSRKTRWNFNVLKNKFWYAANLSIALFFLPGLLTLISLLFHIEELKVGNDVGWIPEVTYSDLPKMYLRFLSGNIDDVTFAEFVSWILAITLTFFISTLSKSFNESHFYHLFVLNLLLPVITVFFISLITPLFIDRYLIFSAMSLPVIIALLVGVCKRKITSFMIFTLLTGYFLFGIFSNTPDKDDFSSLMHFIGRNYKKNDLVIVDTMPHYLSYKFYDKKDTTVLFYTPPKMDGSSTKPNDFGFGAIFKDDQVNSYLENLNSVNGKYRRIWLLSEGDKNSVYKEIPERWKEAGMINIGDYSLYLFYMKNFKKKYPL